METLIIIPAYNEEAHIQSVIKDVLAEGYKPIVIDDGSADQTSQKAREAGATVLRHIVNMGKGAAAKTGCDWAVNQGADAIVLMDGDGQHKAKDIKRALKALKGTNIVFGFRQLNDHMPAVMRFGNWLINGMSSRINGIGLRDTQSGFRAMTTDTYRRIRWRSSDYGMESEMIANVAKKKIAYRQIPIDTIYHDNFKGTTVFDGIRIVLRLLKWRLT